MTAGQADIDELAERARNALASGEEELVLPVLRSAAADLNDARLWQWTGLLQRALDDHAEALRSFAEAARLTPTDQKIAHGRAHVALEAGLDAVGFFETARRLGPPSSDLLLGHAAARLAAGRGEEAQAELDSILAQVPLWLDGHVRLAQLRALLGHPELVTASLERALAQLPKEPVLWRCLFDLHVQREDFAALANTVARAAAAGQARAVWAAHEAIAAAELGQTDRADALFAGASEEMLQGLVLWRVRHLLRSGRAEAAATAIDRALESDVAGALWPYAVAAWRLTGDARLEWLIGDPRLIAVVDLRHKLPRLDRLADVLRRLHVVRGEYLDQSVRGGTQTDGPLLSRIEPEIRAVRDAISSAVEAYVRQLPPVDPQHPLLSQRRDRRLRFAGSWSVLLRPAGFHANHIHQKGWISSALYVSLPERKASEDPHAGWFTLGEPQQALGLDLSPLRMIEPKEGQLVLFPSWMWHGTRSFAAGERLTIAFDVAPPK